jgi:anti-anti-sigma factor
MDFAVEDLDIDIKAKMIKLSGEMDAAAAASVQTEIDKLIQDGCVGLTLDMSEVKYIDSSGIRVLLGTYKKLAKQAGKMNLLKPSEPVVMILELADLTDILKIFDSKDDAIADLPKAS